MGPIKKYADVFFLQASRERSPYVWCQHNVDATFWLRPRHKEHPKNIHGGIRIGVYNQIYLNSKALEESIYLILILSILI